MSRRAGREFTFSTKRPAGGSDGETRGGLTKLAAISSAAKAASMEALADGLKAVLAKQPLNQRLLNHHQCSNARRLGGGMGRLPMRSRQRMAFRRWAGAASAWVKSIFSDSRAPGALGVLVR